MEGRIKNFFHWMCNNYSVKKISSVETYWHQLSQLYIKWKGRRITTILLVAAFTGSRPGAILGITYRDLDLFVQRDKTTGEVALTLQLKFTRTKSRKKRKRP